MFNYRKSGKDYGIIIRHVNEKSEIIESTSSLRNMDFSIDIFDNKGIEGIENIVFVNYFAEACGVDGGGIFFFQTQNELKKVFEIEVSGGEGPWFEEALIFPTDENGVKGKIVYEKEIGKSIDKKTNWVEINKVSRELEWKNEEILPKLIP